MFSSHGDVGVFCYIFSYAARGETSIASCCRRFRLGCGTDAWGDHLAFAAGGVALADAADDLDLGVGDVGSDSCDAAGRFSVSRFGWGLLIVRVRA